MRSSMSMTMNEHEECKFVTGAADITNVYHRAKIYGARGPFAA